MSAFAEWSDKLEELLDTDKTRDALLRLGATDWQLGTNYAFALAKRHLNTQGIVVPRATRGLILATLLASVAAAVAWATFLGVMQPSRLNIALGGAAYLIFQIAFGRILNTLGLSDRHQYLFWLSVGLVFCIFTLTIFSSDTALRIGLTLIVIITSLAAASCALAWARPDVRFRVNLLEMTKGNSFGLDRGTPFLLAMINVANCVANLRKASRAGPEQFAQVRERHGATPGHTAYGSHPLGLTDRQFASDLDLLLAGSLPPHNTAGPQ